MISIHAPAKGATQIKLSNLNHIIFQSTLPRRERRKLLETMRIVVNFNPRSREGSDNIY